MKFNSSVNTLSSVSFAGAMLLCASAFAQDAGYYMGVLAGQSKTDIDQAPFVALGATITRNDEKDSAFRIFGGYQYTKNLAVEVGYVDLGTYGVSGTIGALPFTAFGDVTGFSISGVGTVPLTEKLGLLGSVGFLSSKVNASATVATVSGIARSRQSDYTAGIGMKYSLTKNIAARLEANYYGLNNNGSAQMYSLGLQYKF